MSWDCQGVFPGKNMQESRHIFLLGALDSVFSPIVDLSGLFAFSWAEVKVGSCAVFCVKVSALFLKVVENIPFLSSLF